MTASIPCRENLRQAIEGHLREHGPRNWKLVRDQFSGVSDASFWRTVRRVRTPTDDAADIHQARKRVSLHVAGRLDRQNAKTGTSLPEGEFFSGLNLLRMLENIFDDIQLLRAFSTSAEGAVRNPLFFAQTISMRERTLKTAIGCAQSILNLEYATSFYDAVVDEIALVDPDTAKRITVRLAKLSERIPGDNWVHRAPGQAT
jgi:hypothetical protein